MSKRILIAEDDESIITLLEFLMKRSGYSTRIVRDGGEALAALEAFHPHLVLLDVMLPVKSGHEICRAIRGNPAMLGTRVLMLTAKGALNDVSRGLASGADEYVIKPFSTQDLVARVRALLDDRVPGSRVPEANEP